jgi:cell division protein FtsI (penicillin-binding protein 3)
VDLPGEERGLLKKPTEWSGLSLPIISFGQEIAATPLQIVNAYSAMVNGGYLLEPKVILKVRGCDGREVCNTQRQVIRRPVSTEISNELRKMMVEVVEQGTGQLAKVPGYSVGGKTGTAQKRDPVTKKYSTNCYVASFCGAIPMNNPRLTILVMLDEPKGDYYAASRAAPIFEKIASRAMRYLQIAPDQVTMQLARR